MNEAISNCTGRIERCRTCIAALPIRDCFVPRNDAYIKPCRIFALFKNVNLTENNRKLDTLCRQSKNILAGSKI